MTADNELTTYIALFHHRDNAASAIRDLEASGFASGALTVIGGGNGSTYSEAADTFGQGYGYGNQNGLAEIGVPETDRKHLQDGLTHGGVVLAVKAAGVRADEIEKIFSKHAAKKINEINVENGSYVAPVAAATVPATSLGETIIPVAQEELVVGKREVDRDGVRVFRRIVEEPVSESVSLREEHVVIDRRPVNRAATDTDLFEGDRVVELTEIAEEAVVGKSARVVEEIYIGKETTQHTETIHDTVRRTEVDVEQLGSMDRAHTETKY